MLLRELIAKACSFDFSYSKSCREYRLAKVVADEIGCAEQDICSLTMPNDKRLKKGFNYLKKHPGLDSSSDVVAGYVSVTPRTLSRLCHKEFGFSFDHWRVQIMMMESLVMLEQGKSLGYISQKLGYSSESAFIYRFKQWIGTTPHTYKSSVSKK